MGFKANEIRDNSKLKEPTNTSHNSLNNEDIEVLLNIIKNSTFQGKDIEILYQLIIKLQNQYKNNIR